VRTFDVARLGVTEIDGADIVGGEIFPWSAVGVGLLIAAGAALMRDWDDVKAGFVSGFKDASGGSW
jgi:hypothetical protein